MGFNNTEFQITHVELELEGWTKTTGGGVVSYYYNNSRSRDGKILTENDYNVALITTKGEKLSNSWYKYNNEYWVISSSGVITKSTKNAYEASQRTPTEQTRFDNDPSNIYLESPSKITDDSNPKFADLVSDNQINITKRMQDFKSMLSKLEDKFCNNRAVYTMYFKMNLTVNDAIKTVTLVDTTSPDWVANNILSFTHNMNGLGEANTFTLDIIYKPDERNILQIDMLETRLLAACAIYENENKLKDEKHIYNNCTFQYGYGDDYEMRSPEYYGTIMDYDCKLENGNLHYTITGYCGLYSAKEYRIAPKSEYLTDANGNTINDPMSYIQRIFEIEFKDSKSYDVKFINIDINDVIYPGDTYKQFSQKNIFQVVKDILSSCMTKSQYTNLMNASTGDSTSTKTFYPNQKQSFDFFIDDKSLSANGEYGTVVIYKLESLYSDENSKVTEDTILPDCNIEFSWFAPTSGSINHVVKDWHPQYEGSALLAMATTVNSRRGVKYSAMTDDGDIVEVTSLGAARLGASSDANNTVLSTIQEYDNWTFPTQYPYNAKMTLLGVPCEVPMTGKIKVLARMGTQLHHSSGVYMVLNKVDKISSSGFFTELSLFKFTRGFNPDYVSEKVKFGRVLESAEDREQREQKERYEKYKDVPYTEVPYYSRDATPDDMYTNTLSGRVGMVPHTSLFVGTDNSLYLKSMPYKVWVPASYRKPVEENKNTSDVHTLPPIFPTR